MKTVIGTLGGRTTSALVTGALLVILAPAARAQDAAASAPTQRRPRWPAAAPARLPRHPA